jgi:central glycolytic genes regulator
MGTLLDVQRKLLPDLLDVMRSRYRILQSVHFLQPIGRRSLSGHLGITERVLRSEVELLSEQGLLHITSSGMVVTDEGNIVLVQLEEIMKEVSGLTVLERRIKETLNLAEVIVVPGDSDHDPMAKKELGKACVYRLLNCLTTENTIAVTGGTTLAAVADVMVTIGKENKVMFLPARGGLGERVENQANTICSTMAHKANGQYKLLHVPDQISPEAYRTLLAEPSVKEVINLIRHADIIIHGIGDAKTMATRRKSSEDVLRIIEKKQAVAEAFGYYFNQNGDIIHKVQTVGLQLDDLQDTNYIFAVAGGKSKARAIAAYLKRSPKQILITDEGAAREILFADGITI